MWLRALSSLAMTLVALGCAARPLPPEALRDPDLASIVSRFERVVADALEDPEWTWTHGWTGNMQVHGNERTRGLCYEWQSLVFHGVKDTVAERGWELAGITSDFGTWLEHHAVVVYDPEIVAEEDVLARRDSVYVLDAWARGRADVFALDQWLAAGLLHLEAPSLEAVDPLDP